MILTIHSNIIFANQSYMFKDINYGRTFSFMTRILERMENIPDYIPNETQVLFIGNIYKNNTYFDNATQKAYSPHNNTVVDVLTYPDTYIWYFKYILGINIKIIPIKKAEAFVLRKDISSMPIFPHKDSIKMLDGVLVIKVDDEYKASSL